MSVLEIVNNFELINGVKVPYSIEGRREGDLEKIYCDNTKAKEELLWSPKKNIDDICEDSWNFIKQNNQIS